MTPSLCDSPALVVVRFRSSATANTCNMTMTPNMPITMPTMTSIKPNPPARRLNDLKIRGKLFPLT